MWKLTIEDDEGKRTPLSLGREEYSIGRGEENTVRLTERNISRKHAVLKRNGSGWVVTDPASYNGSYVNGVRLVGEHLITQGDILQVGDYRLEFADEETTGRSPDSTNAATLPGGGPAAAKPDRLVVVVGPEPGEEFLISAATLSIGRAPELNICIPHSSVSRLHAEVHALGGGRYEIIDKASANGVRVNGSLLKRGLLEAGDSIVLGEVHLKFIGAGQAYRPGPEAHRLVSPSEEEVAKAQPSSTEGGTLRPPPPSGPVFGTSSSIDDLDGGGRSKFVKNLMIGAAVGLIAVGGLFAMKRSKNPTSSAASAEAPMDPAHAALAEAKKLAAQGDLDLAHARIAADVAGATSLHDAPEVRDIETRWADALLLRADQETDIPTRRMLLGQVAQSSTVDAARRRTAADKLKEVDYLGTDIHELPKAAKEPAAEKEKEKEREREATAQASPSPAPRAAAKPSLAADPWSSGGNSGGAKATEPASESASGKTNDLALQGRDGEAKARAALEPRVFGGRASPDEIRMLKAICKHQGDRACSDRAAALLANLK